MAPACSPVEPGTFQVMPSLRVHKRRVVDAQGQVVDRSAADAVKALAAKGPVWVYDLDGLGRNKADLDTLRKAGDRGNVWVDAGSRFATDAMDVLVAGAEKATLRWDHLASEAELAEAVEMSDALLLGLVFDRGQFQRNPLLEGDEQRVLGVARDLGMGIAVIDATERPIPGGADRNLAARFAATGLDRWFVGGARDEADAREVEALGYQGAVLEPERPRREAP
jgi:uncharacterized protein related to proFAR isomerase